MNVSGIVKTRHCEAKPKQSKSEIALSLNAGSRNDIFQKLHCNSPKRIKGFTFIELLVVIVLFSAGAVSLLQIFSMTIYGGSENQNTLIATGLAQEKMELIRNSSYSSVGNEVRAAIPNYTFFQREVVVTTPIPNLKEVDVNVYWTERPHDAAPGAGDVKISLVTYVSNI